MFDYFVEKFDCLVLVDVVEVINIVVEVGFQINFLCLMEFGGDMGMKVIMNVFIVMIVENCQVVIVCQVGSVVFWVNCFSRCVIVLVLGLLCLDRLVFDI